MTTLRFILPALLLQLGLLLMAAPNGLSRGVQIDLELYCTPDAVHVSQRYELPDYLEVPADSLSLHPLVKDSLGGYPQQATLIWKRNGEQMEREVTLYELHSKHFALPKDLQKKGMEEFTLLYTIRPKYIYHADVRQILASIRIDPAFTMRLARMGATLNLSVDVSALMAAGGSGKMINSGMALGTGLGKQSFPVKNNNMKRLWLHLERNAWSIDHDDDIVRIDGFIFSELGKQAIVNMQDNDLGTAAYLAVSNSDTLRMKVNQRGAEALVIGNGLMLTAQVMRSFSRISRVQLEITTVTPNGQRHRTAKNVSLEDTRPPAIQRPLLACLPLQLVYVAPQGHSIEEVQVVATDYYKRDAHPGPNRYAISEFFFVRGLYSR